MAEIITTYISLSIAVASILFGNSPMIQKLFKNSLSKIGFYEKSDYYLSIENHFC